MLLKTREDFIRQYQVVFPEVSPDCQFVIGIPLSIKRDKFYFVAKYFKGDSNLVVVFIENFAFIKTTDASFFIPHETAPSFFLSI